MEIFIIDIYLQKHYFFIKLPSCKAKPYDSLFNSYTAKLPLYKISAVFFFLLVPPVNVMMMP